MTRQPNSESGLPEEDCEFARIAGQITQRLRMIQDASGTRRHQEKSAIQRLLTDLDELAASDRIRWPSAFRDQLVDMGQLIDNLLDLSGSKGGIAQNAHSLLGILLEEWSDQLSDLLASERFKSEKARTDAVSAALNEDVGILAHGNLLMFLLDDVFEQLPGEVTRNKLLGGSAENELAKELRFRLESELGFLWAILPEKDRRLYRQMVWATVGRRMKSAYRRASDEATAELSRKPKRHEVRLASDPTLEATDHQFLVVRKVERELVEQSNGQSNIARRYQSIGRILWCQDRPTPLPLAQQLDEIRAFLLESKAAMKAAKTPGMTKSSSSRSRNGTYQLD